VVSFDITTSYQRVKCNVHSALPTGTGHGVGAALNVHEGPQRISSVLTAQPLLPGMIVSNEPGYYERGNFGIRIENLLEVVENPNGYLGFKRLTYIPMQEKLMDKALMTDKDLEWVNGYHAEVRERVMPLVQTDAARTWLQAHTQPIAR
jgi:Xaa-Pro aminopeptidase